MMRGKGEREFLKGRKFQEKRRLSDWRRVARDWGIAVETRGSMWSRRAAG
jgi:hypothetical protein